MQSPPSFPSCQAGFFNPHRRAIILSVKRKNPPLALAASSRPIQAGKAGRRSPIAKPPSFQSLPPNAIFLQLASQRRVSTSSTHTPNPGVGLTWSTSQPFPPALPGWDFLLNPQISNLRFPGLIWGGGRQKEPQCLLLGKGSPLWICLAPLGRRGCGGWRQPVYGGRWRQVSPLPPYSEWEGLGQGGEGQAAPPGSPLLPCCMDFPGILKKLPPKLIPDPMIRVIRCPLMSRTCPPF